MSLAQGWFGAWRLWRMRRFEPTQVFARPGWCFKSLAKLSHVLWHGSSGLSETADFVSLSLVHQPQPKYKPLLVLNLDA